MPEQRTVDARPEKSFFIEMLIRDVALVQVIPDLIDNSVDAARRLRPEQDFEGLLINITVSNDYFEIKDNCGGIDIETAANYAFRFGRPQEREPDPNSIGQFGIGMKRAIFKLGNRFRVESTTARGHFVIDVDVQEWATTDDWFFKFTQLDELKDEDTPYPPEQWGTSLSVYDLHPTVAERFAQDTFISELKLGIEEDHLASLDRGLSIRLNNVRLQPKILRFATTEDIRPGYEHHIDQQPNQAPVDIDIYVGVEEPNSTDYGWYVFCNGRLVLAADKTPLTGWGKGDRDDINPQAHIQFNRFRGYIFFESEAPSRLPWNTTKDGIDADAPLFRAMRLRMETMMRPVIDMLNKIHREEQQSEENRPLSDHLASSRVTRLVEIDFAEPAAFSWPRQRIARVPKTTVSITYSRPVEKVERLKQALDITSNRELGEETFDYVYRLECEE